MFKSIQFYSAEDESRLRSAVRGGRRWTIWENIE